MPSVTLHLLGSPRIELAGEQVHFSRRKALALLAYLAVTDQSHTRDALATLFWPVKDQTRARSNLRGALVYLRKVLGEGWLETDRESVGLSRHSESGKHPELVEGCVFAPGSGRSPDSAQTLWLDVTEFQQHLAACQAHGHAPDQVCQACLPLLEHAAELYRGDFMAGFTLPNCPDFDEWQYFQSEGLRGELAGALERLANGHAAQGEYEPAITYARRYMALDQLNEPAHRLLMQLYAWSGQRSAAMRQYAACQQTLEEELGVPPSAETTALCERILEEELAAPTAPVETVRGYEPRERIGTSDFRQAPALAQEPSLPASAPGFLAQGPEQPRRAVFVARERELQWLEAFLQRALAGHGQVAFVTGGPGRGKTALINEFARRAMDAHPDLLAVGGNCNAFFGVADPYLPFRDALAMLCGNVEHLWAGGAITRDHARRLWGVLPLTLRALLEHGPSLIDAFVSGSELLSRVASAALPQGGSSWLARLQAHVERSEAAPRSLEQTQLFDQYASVLRALAAQHTLLILLDDMQWADTGSAGLLFHLGQRLALAGSRIMIICAYRPEELVIGKGKARADRWESHPLEKTLSELKRQFGDVWLDLARVDEEEGRAFVGALVDTEPNRLTEDFRVALFQHTRGHPLFTVELLRAMQERGDLVRDEGEWTAGPTLDWDTLPPRVEGVIEERLARLSDELLGILSVASVEGELFIAQVAARVQGIGEREVLRALSQQAERRHRLIQGRGEIQVGPHRLSRYQFTHTLLQRYFFNSLGAGERRLLHREIAQLLEDLYVGRTEEIAVQLARHFELAGVPERAVEYLLQAGDQSRALYANAEAERHYQQAVRFLSGSGQDELAARTLMKLGLVHTAAFEPAKAQAVYTQAFALWEQAHTRTDVPQPRKPAAVLRLAIEQPLTLDPGRVADDVSRFIAVQLFEGLVRVGRDHNVLPAVAARWEINDDGTRYIFHLRDDVRWSDETPLTAADFAYAITRNLNPSSASPQAHLLFAIKNARRYHEGESDDPGTLGVVAVDDHTLEINLESPKAYLPYLLAHPVAYPLPRWALERDDQAWTAADNLISNGPYELVAWDPDERMVLNRNPLYSGDFTGNVKRVECPIFVGYEPALQGYATDEVDVVSMINADPDTVARARALFGDELVSIPRPVVLYLMFRADGPPFDDARVRKAFIHAVDRQAMVSKAFDNRRLPATGGFVPPAFPGHSPDIGLAYDPEGARRMLAEAGYPYGRGFPSIRWIHGPADERVIPFLRRSWRDNLGLNLESQSVDFRVLFESVAGDLAQLTMIGWSASYPDPDSVLRVTFHSREGVSNPRWRNARFDHLVEQATRVTDHARRMVFYQEADRILVSEDAVVMPLTYGQRRMLLKPWVTLPRSPSIFLPLNAIGVERRTD